jgi:hypothetical protein
MAKAKIINQAVEKNFIQAMNEELQKIVIPKGTDSAVITQAFNSDKINVFIGWSGPTGRKIAKALTKWLPIFIDSVDPFYSDKTEKGKVGFNKITQRCIDSDIGIFCLTPDIKNPSWIHFEAGIIFKSPDDPCVYPVLFGRPENNKDSPLSEIQHTLFKKDDFLQLLEAINNKGKNSKITEDDLKATFKTNWPNFKSSIDKIILTNMIQDNPQNNVKNDKLIEDYITNGIDKILDWLQGDLSMIFVFVYGVIYPVELSKIDALLQTNFKSRLKQISEFYNKDSQTDEAEIKASNIRDSIQRELANYRVKLMEHPNPTEKQKLQWIKEIYEQEV